MRERQSPFNSIKYRLALMFFAITAGAIMIIYFYVVPQLESSLTDGKLEGLRKDAAAYSKPLERTIGRDVFGPELDRLTRGIGEQAGAGVTLLGIPRNERGSGGEAAPPYVISDSREAVSRLEPASSTVLAAVRERKVKTATRSEGGNKLAQVAKPLYYKGEPAWVVVYSAPLSDVTDNVSLIERQILIAGGIALLVALISGYYASNALTKRVKRLERAAGEVAAGNFSDPPIPVDSEDELGQLARAFNEMQRKLAGLDQARKEFIANASHELRTPIFSLGGFVELLLDEDIDETTRSEFLTTMGEQVERLQKLTTDLLDLSRLDAGSLEVELGPVPLLTLANQVTAEFAAAAAMQRAQINVTPVDPEQDVEAESDFTRVAQILRALLDNALTHTGEGTSVVVQARSRPPLRNGRAMVELTVTDDGPGIPREQLPKVFDRFHSGDAGQGSGLGLSIARQLAERMLGRLDVTSASGHTTFTLTLPAALRRDGRDGRPFEAAAASSAGAGPLTSRRAPA